MRYLRSLMILVLVQAPAAFACSCIRSGSACSDFSGTEVVFLGHVVDDGGQSWGNGPAKMIVEEVLHGLPKDVSAVTVDTAAGTSCHLQLQMGERYVIYAGRTPGSTNRVRTNVCSFSFRVAGNETLLSALRQAQAGGRPRLIGKVRRMREPRNFGGEVAAAVRVAATIEGRHLEAVTNSDGEFEFRDVTPGAYHLQISSPDLFEEKSPWTVENPKAPASGCDYQTLYIWPDGHVEGTVRGPDGKPLVGVPVQAFVTSSMGEFNRPIREEQTDQHGHYVLRGLPEGEFVIAINGELAHDKLAWPPAFYKSSASRDKATILRLDRGQKLTGIDLQVGKPRQPATLSIEAVFEDGTPASQAGASVEDLTGTPRGLAEGYTDKAGLITIPVFIGETYKVKTFGSGTVTAGSEVGLKFWGGESEPILVSAPQMHVRLVLHVRPKP